MVEELIEQLNDYAEQWKNVPMLAKTQYQGGMQEGLRTALTIHNLHFQGQ